MSKKKATTKPAATEEGGQAEVATAKPAPAYLVRFENAPEVDGMIRATEFHKGHGIVDRYSLSVARRDWVDPQSLEFKSGIGPEVVGELAKYWSGRGAKVTKVTEEAADRERDKLQKDPTGHLPKPKAEKPKAKSKGKAGKVASKTPPHKTPKE